MASAVMITNAMANSAIVATATQAKPQDADPFRKGDFVVYPAHGVGTVDRVGPEEVGGHRVNLIRICFSENRMTLRIPVAKARAVGLRRLATREAFEEVLTILQGRPRANRLIWAKRAQEYQLKINSGDLYALAEVVRDLRPGPDGAGASFSQRNLFEAAFDRLAAEFAALSRTDKPAAVAWLNQTLQESGSADGPVCATENAPTPVYPGNA
jgi:CarD family transcriptional regulator